MSEALQLDSAPVYVRPAPPLRLRLAAEGPADPAARFEPAPDLAAWIRACFIEEGGPLYNIDHGHLAAADILCIWTNVPKSKNGREIWAEARLVRGAGDKWASGTSLQQLREWNGGELPDFTITFYAPASAQMNDPTFCATADHECYHCSIKLDENDLPDVGEEGNDPAWTMRGHDVEQFVGVTRRHGAAASGVADLVAAAMCDPLLTAAHYARACGGQVTPGEAAVDAVAIGRACGSCKS